MLELDQLFSTNVINLTLKIPLALLVFVFFIFTLIVASRVRALNRSVHVWASSASKTLLVFSILYSIAVFFLFIIVLVIV